MCSGLHCCDKLLRYSAYKEEGFISACFGGLSPWPVALLLLALWRVSMSCGGGGHNGATLCTSGPGSERGWGWGASVPLEGSASTNLNTSHQAPLPLAVPRWASDLNPWACGGHSRSQLQHALIFKFVTDKTFIPRSYVTTDYKLQLPRSGPSRAVPRVGMVMGEWQPLLGSLSSGRSGYLGLPWEGSGWPEGRYP